MAQDLDRPPRFSILLPTHNRAHILPFAVRSVLTQTVQDFELLIVGDGCTDQTAPAVEALADPRIRWFDLPKTPGFGYANRNVALQQARGKYIAFLSDDDLWFPDHLELLGPCLEPPGIELVYSRPLWVAQGVWIVPGTFNLSHAPTLDAFLARETNGVPAGCVIHRRECFAKYGYWDETLPSCGDWDMWARIISGGGRDNFVAVPDPTCLHFRAHWRTEAIVMDQLGPDWEPFRALSSSIPSALQIRNREAATPQEAVLQAISSQPEAWPRQVRAGVRRALDWRVSTTNGLIRKLHRQAAENQQLAETLSAEAVQYRLRIHTLETEVAERQRQARVLDLELHAIRASKAWRAAVWLRRLRLWLIPPASRRARSLGPLYRSVLSFGRTLESARSKQTTIEGRDSKQF